VHAKGARILHWNARAFATIPQPRIAILCKPAAAKLAPRDRG
jgi:hypothetical protein